jgi:hypothetical protein
MQEPSTPQSIELDVPSYAVTAASRINFRLLQPQTLNPQIPNGVHPVSLHLPSAETPLQFFQNNMASHFPFVVIPPGITSYDLCTASPFLYEIIMMVTSYPQASRQAILRSEIMESLTKQVFLQGKKSLDLLQGILLFAAWYHHHLWESPQLTNLLQLATAMLFDLGLHKTQNTLVGHDIFIDAIRSFNDKRRRLPRTLEERRVFLGIFCLSRV